MSDQRPDEDRGAHRPQVIDLDAEEIRTEAEAPKPEGPQASTADETPPPPPFKPVRRGGAATWIIAALILGALGGGWLYRDVLSSYLPSNEMKALKAQVAALEVNNSALAEQVATAQQAADAAAAAAASAGQGVEGAAKQAKSAAAASSDLAQRLDALDQRIAAAETGLGTATADLDAFRKSLSAAPAATGGTAQPIDNAALAALAQRIDSLEKDVASLKSPAAQAGGNDKASVTSALSQALSDLKAKAAAGAPYAPEYERIARMVPAAPGLDTVASHAELGLPNAQGLTEELRAAIPSLPQPAAPAAADDSYFGTLMKSLSGIITIREIGEADWPAVAEKAAAFAESGDLDQAISVIDAAEGEKPMALTQWRDRAAQRLQLDAAMAALSDAVIRQISALGGTTP